MSAEHPVQPFPIAQSAQPEARVAGPRRAVRPRMLTAHVLIARTLLAGLTLQIFFAGLGIFGAATFEAHAILGPVIILVSLATPIVAWAGHLESPRLRNSWILVGLMVLQGLLIGLEAISPAITALHPVNAMLLVLLTYRLAIRHS